MSDVTFEEPEYASVKRNAESKKISSFEKIIISMRLAKDAKGAQQVLLIISVLMIVIAIYLMWPQQSKAPTVPPPAFITTP